jgi:phospholipid N-methyltransferase
MASTFKAVDAQGYQQIMGRFSTQLASSFLDYIGRESGQTILDLGCGTGSMTFTLAQRGDHKASTESMSARSTSTTLVHVMTNRESHLRLPMGQHCRLRTILSTRQFPSWFFSSCQIRFRLSRKCAGWSNPVG